MSQEQAIKEITKIKNRGFFTASQTLEEYVRGFRLRWLRLYGELLPNDYRVILQHLKAH